MFVFTDYKGGLKSLYKGFDVLETKKKKKNKQEIGYYEESFTVEHERVRDLSRRYFA